MTWDSFYAVYLSGHFTWCSVARWKMYFFLERGCKRRGEENQGSLYKVTDSEISMPKLYCFCLSKKELRILVTQNKCWSCPIWGESEWREINPHVPHCHMLSELGSREVCKSIQELDPSLPTNGAEVKGKEFWQSPTHKLLSRCQFTQPDNSFPSPYWKAQIATRENYRRVQAGEKRWYFWSLNLAFIHSFLSTLSSAQVLVHEASCGK